MATNDTKREAVERAVRMLTQGIEARRQTVERLRREIVVTEAEIIDREEAIGLLIDQTED